jgi:hypothetical protein
VLGASSATYQGGVYGYHTAVNGKGVIGQAVGAGSSGVYGVGSNAGVWGEGPKNGLIGLSAGRGALLYGDRAHLRLQPHTTALTHPTVGKRGDLFVDKTGRLWYCRTGGAVSDWKQLA